jgi:hypothetical protein
VEVALSVQQAWDHRDEGWDLQLFVELYSTSPAWKQHLFQATKAEENECEEEEECEKEEEEEGKGKDDGSRVVVFDYYRTRGELDEKPSVKYSILRKLWQCLGLNAKGDADADAGADDDRWSVREALTTLLARLSFAWKPDVELLWEGGYWGDDEGGDADVEGGDTTSNDYSLKRATALKRKERLEMREYLDQFNALLGQQQLPQVSLLLYYYYYYYLFFIYVHYYCLFLSILFGI